MPEQKTLICTRISDKGYVTPGSLPGRCSECGERVVISPSSWLIMADSPGMILICLHCFPAYLKEHPGPAQAPTPAQREEIAEANRFFKERRN